MVTALLITGDTYTSRRDIKALGGKWNPEETGWLVPPSDAARQFAETKGFKVSEIEVDPILLEHPTGERLRAIRQDKLDRRAAKNLARAERGGAWEETGDRERQAQARWKARCATWCSSGGNST